VRLREFITGTSTLAALAAIVLYFMRPVKFLVRHFSAPLGALCARGTKPTTSGLSWNNGNHRLVFRGSNESAGSLSREKFVSFVRSFAPCGNSARLLQNMTHLSTFLSYIFLLQRSIISRFFIVHLSATAFNYFSLYCMKLLIILWNINLGNAYFFIFNLYARFINHIIYINLEYLLNVNMNGIF